MTKHGLRQRIMSPLAQRSTFSLVGLIATAFWAGCVHGDFIILRDVRGHVLDNASGAPLVDAQVTAVLRTDSRKRPVVQNRGRTAAGGRFSIPVTIGGGSVNWVFFIPIVWGDLAAPKVWCAMIVVESSGQSVTIERAIETRAQSTTCAQTPIELGDLQIDFVQQPDEPAR